MLDFGRALGYLGRAGWDNDNTLQSQGERYLDLMRDVQMIDDLRGLTPTGSEVKNELTLPVHMSLLDIAGQQNPGGPEAVRAAGEAEWAAAEQAAAPEPEPEPAAPAPTPAPAAAEPEEEDEWQDVGPGAPAPAPAPEPAAAPPAPAPAAGAPPDAARRHLGDGRAARGDEPLLRRRRRAPGDGARARAARGGPARDDVGRPAGRRPRAAGRRGAGRAGAARGVRPARPA